MRTADGPPAGSPRRGEAVGGTSTVARRLWAEAPGGPLAARSGASSSLLPSCHTIVHAAGSSQPRPDVPPERLDELLRLTSGSAARARRAARCSLASASSPDRTEMAGRWPKDCRRGRRRRRPHHRCTLGFARRNASAHSISPLYHSKHKRSMKHAPKTFVMPPVSTGPIQYVTPRALAAGLLLPLPSSSSSSSRSRRLLPIIFTTRTTSEDIGCIAFVYLFVQ